MFRQHRAVAVPCPVPAIHSRSRLVCRAGKGKKPAKHKPQRPAKRKAKDVLKTPPQSGRLQLSGKGLEAAFETCQEQLLEAGIHDARVPKFHKEFEAAAKEGALGLTAQEAAAVEAKAADAYSTACFMPASREAMFGDDFDSAVGMRNLGARLGHRVLDQEFMEAYRHIPPGTVFLKEASLPYDPFNQCFQSFANTPCESVHLLPGSTHVAVGYADLGELAAAVCRWGTTRSGQLAAYPLEFDQGRPDAAAMQADVAASIHRFEQGNNSAPYDQRDLEGNSAHALLQVLHCVQQVHAGSIPTAASGSSNGNGSSSTHVLSVSGKEGQPLLWVGYDASPYAVAKTAVLLQMLKQGADTDAVLQIWYSSCWSHSTKAAFQSALQAVLSGSAEQGDSQSGTAQQRCSDKVLQLLQHWQQHPDVTLTQSRSSWLERVDKSNGFIGGFCRPEDRLALTRYNCTGELLTADVGSTVMCSLPDDFGTLDTDETFLATFHTSTLLRAWQLEQYPDVVAAGVSVLRRRIARLGELLRKGSVVAEVRHGAVTADNTQLLSDIQLLQPLTISWSNVPDYLQAEEFHLMAQQCSARATVHLMHCMNWVREVKGACWIDWIMDRLTALDEGLQDEADAVGEFVQGILDKSSEAIHDSYAALGVDKLLLTMPTVDNPRNIVDATLHSRLFTEWLSAFMVWAEEVASETTSPSIIRIAAAVQKSVPSAPGQNSEVEALVPEDDGLTLCLPLSAPCYGPLQRTSATFDVAFVQYSDAALNTCAGD